MTTLTLVSDEEVTCGPGDIVTVVVTVSDSTKPVFTAADQTTPLRAKKVGGSWSATWVTGAVGESTITVTAADATPEVVTVTVEADGPEPGDDELDVEVAGLVTDEGSATRAAITATFGLFDTGPRRFYFPGDDGGYHFIELTYVNGTMFWTIEMGGDLPVSDYANVITSAAWRPKREQYLNWYNGDESATSAGAIRVNGTVANVGGIGSLSGSYQPAGVPTEPYPGDGPPF